MRTQTGTGHWRLTYEGDTLVGVEVWDKPPQEPGKNCVPARYTVFDLRGLIRIVRHVASIPLPEFHDTIQTSMPLTTIVAARKALL